MLLSDVKIKSLKPRNKPYKVSDGDGMYLLVKPNGSRLWRLKYRIKGKENVFSIGGYPEIPLAEARNKRFEIRKSIKEGIDPNKLKKTTLSLTGIEYESSFKFIAEEWVRKNINKWSKEHGQKIKNWIEKDILPYIGDMKISEVKAPNILLVIKNVESRGATDVARRVLSISSQIFKYAMPIGKCDYDVTAGINKVLEVRKRTNFKCIALEEFPKLLRTIENHNCNPLTKYALQLIVLTFVRSSELREAKWAEINFEKEEWRIPAVRMKMKELHIVPLSKQAIAFLIQIKNLGFESDYIFPNINNTSKVMSENTMLYALYDMGYHNKMTVHGFRQLASTVLNEQGFNPDAIERQLSHAERNNVRRAYNHAQYLLERKQMMQWWGNFITELKG